MFDYKTTFPPFKFSIIRITYMLKVLCVANSDTKIQIFKLHTHCKNCVYLIVLSILCYINAGKSRILSIFVANCGFLLHFGGIIPKNRDIQSKIPNNYKCQLHFTGVNPKNWEILAKYWQIQSNFPKTQDIR